MSAPFFYTPKLKYWIPNTNNPATSYWVKTFAAGTSNPLALFFDSNLTVPAANPLQLDINGEAIVYAQAGVAYKAQLLLPDGVTPVAGETTDGILIASGSGGGATTSGSQWINSTSLGVGAPTFISSTSFSVAGNFTSVFPVGTVLQSTNTGGIVYSQVTVSSFGGGFTTVTVVNFVGVLDTGLSVVNVGVITPSNPGVPQRSALTVGYAHNTETFVNNTQLTLSTANNVSVTPFNDIFSEFAAATGLWTAKRAGSYLVSYAANITVTGVTITNAIAGLTGSFTAAGTNVPTMGITSVGAGANTTPAASSVIVTVAVGQTIGLAITLTFSAGSPHVGAGNLTITGPL